jgi:hypothetical protein
MGKISLEVFMPRRMSLSVASLVFGVLLMAGLPGHAQVDKKDKSDAAVDRARATAQMLDDLYKAYVVNITATYVDAQNSVPAAKVTMKVFKFMEKQGHHKARLIDGTGDPVNKANLPKTDFEKAAIAQMKAGKKYHEEVAADGSVLRVATIVPVVMKQCITCHPGKKEGDLLGAIVYEVPIKR